MTKKKSKCDRCFYKLVCKDISLKEDSFNYIDFIIEKIIFPLIWVLYGLFIAFGFYVVGEKVLNLMAGILCH